MRRRLLGGFLSFAILTLVLLEIPFGLSLASSARASALSVIENDGASISVLVSTSLREGDATDAKAILDRFARSNGAIVAVLEHGRLAYSAGAGASEEIADPATKAILRSAAVGRVLGEEGSNDPDDDLLYVAIPVSVGSPDAGGPAAGDRPGGVLLVAEPSGALHSRIGSIREELLVFGGAMLAIAAAIGYLLAGSLTRPLARIQATVSKFGVGQLGARVEPVRGPAELRDLTTTVNQMADRTEELLHSQRAFVADASHQLRAPMTALRLRLENLEGALASGEEADLAPAIAEVDRLSHVVDGLLELARSDGARPTREAVDVGDVIRDRLDAWGALADEQGVRLVAVHGNESSGAAPLGALAGPGFLEQVLDNLLANAIDATPPGGSVSISAGHQGGHVVLHVVDTGAGMAPADRTRAFDRFWRPEGAPPEGTGLGLAIVAQLVRASGGSVRLDQAKEGGVDAVIELEPA